MVIWLSSYKFSHVHVDVDECRVDPPADGNNHDVTSYHECDKNALCINTVGSYRCECSEGFKGNGTHCTRKYNNKVSKSSIAINIQARFVRNFMNTSMFLPTMHKNCHIISKTCFCESMI